MTSTAVPGWWMMPPRGPSSFPPRGHHLSLSDLARISVRVLIQALFTPIWTSTRSISSAQGREKMCLTECRQRTGCRPKNHFSFLFSLWAATTRPPQLRIEASEGVKPERHDVSQRLEKFGRRALLSFVARSSCSQLRRRILAR